MPFDLRLYPQAFAKVGYFVVLNEVKDLNLLNLQDSSLHSE
jgi:hypothetical protein